MITERGFRVLPGVWARNRRTSAIDNPANPRAPALRKSRRLMPSQKREEGPQTVNMMGFLVVGSILGVNPMEARYRTSVHTRVVYSQKWGMATASPSEPKTYATGGSFILPHRHDHSGHLRSRLARTSRSRSRLAMTSCPRSGFATIPGFVRFHKLSLGR